MSASNRQISMEMAATVIGSLQRKGVRLYFDNGELRYKAPKGALTREEVDGIRASRDQIVWILRGAAGAEPGRQVHLAPLSFSQLAHWRIGRLHEQPSIRQIVSATRLKGQLDVHALQQSITEMVRRHDALRTRIIVSDGEPNQQIAKSGGGDIEIEDLAGVPDSSREVEVLRQIEQFVLVPIDVAADALFGARLLKVSDHEHVLILAMEHSIADGYSRGVLLRDVFAAYDQVCAGEPISLPTVAVQLADYAAWQRNAHPAWLQKHGAYWDERLAGCGRVRFPRDPVNTTANRRGWGWVPLRIGPDLKSELTRWCRVRRTTLVIGMFAAYVALVLRWCNERDAVFRYQVDGRNPGLENAIGYFASVLHLRVELAPRATFSDLLSCVVAEHLHAHEHADACYIDSQSPERGFVRNGRFNWIPGGAKLAPPRFGSAGLNRAPMQFQHPALRNMDVDREPGVLLYDMDDEVTGGVIFPLSQFSTQIMDGFARNLMLVIGAMLRAAESCVADLKLQ